MRDKLHIDYASYKAAKYACENWHYTKTVPVGKMVRIGAWEDKKYIGCLIYSRGASPHLGSPYNLDQDEICELTRAAFTSHKTPISKIMAYSFKLLKKRCPG